MEQVNSFVFYRSFQDAIDQLCDEDQLKIYRAISDYALNGIEPISGLEKILMSVIKPQIDANMKRRNDGKSGGRPKQEKTDNHRLLSEKPVVIEQETSGYAFDNHRLLSGKPNANVNANANENEKVEVDNAREAAPPPPPIFYLKEVQEWIAEAGLNYNAAKFLKWARTQNAMNKSDLIALFEQYQSQSIRPELAQVRLFMSENGIHNVDAARFLTYYDEHGWDDVKNWQARIKKWSQKDSKFGYQYRQRQDGKIEFFIKGDWHASKPDITEQEFNRAIETI